MTVPDARPGWLARGLYPFEDHWANVDGRSARQLNRRAAIIDVNGFRERQIGRSTG
jgi:hypothetical protein